MEDAKTWTVGIVGCGHAGAHHAPAFAAQPGFELAGCASRRQETARAFGARHGADAYASPEALLDDDDVDVVVLTTPEWVRLELLEDALRRGRHLFVEKPLYAANGAKDVREQDHLDARRALTAWDRERTTFGVNFNYRTMPHLRQLKADVEAGRLGEVKVVRAWAHFACWPHVIDQLRWLLGEVESVAALSLGGQLDRVATLRFADGPIGTLCGTSGRFERASLLRIELDGTAARATVEGVHGSYRRDDEGGGDSVVWTNPDVAGQVYATSYTDSIAAYCAALRAGEPPPVSGDDGLAELAIEAAIDRSARTGAPQRVVVD
ncbi:Gfo/Idh/MocA family protein [Conexibacter woesei]|uniref:Oxidoreductase domain protein n=1 Tax=Conexibacter woesei (strain DSM 14684 / CCUG 47730 / CIP 108061 / JCM 11494 / NBRC 100937 / ID131577) TaxID=469383 RepID=D3F396_CONWI|nr:Gfo/Idh/MocA family oxidoreductase [Conexibacter woesei]ADB50376.1 oxidoreductase domain protein [Conexibacter woesei DSM 14684]